jgi:hypothetical protein
MASIFIGSGIHGHVMGEGEGFIASARQVLAADGAMATYAMPELRW